MQVHAHPQSRSRRSRRIAAATRRRTRSSPHRCSRSHLAIALRSLARVQRDAGGEKRLRTAADASMPGGCTPRSRRAWRGVAGASAVRSAAGTRSSHRSQRASRMLRWGRRRRLACELRSHVAHPERHRRLGDAERLGDVVEGAAFGAQESGLLLIFDLASVAHAGDAYRGGVTATTLRGSRGGAANASDDAASRASSTRSGGCARA